ncbi:MAG: phosphogluconate dehydrogenase (NAD(+)-dependent, decarboxylating) [Methanotrichaceae archaeon]
MEKSEEMKLGIIGLGKIGGNLALQAVEKGIFVVGKDKSENRSKTSHLENEGVNVVDSYESFVDLLDPPRVVYLSLPAGPTIDHVLEKLLPYLDESDVVIDGSNSFYFDSIRREEDLADAGIYFLDCGTSGGLEGARNGACFMVGGNPEGVKIAEPILKILAVDGGYIYTGEPGSGHFVNLIHKGIELGMLQAIGEGTALLKGSDFNLDLVQVFKNWSHGSIIGGWLIELMAKGLETKRFEDVPPYVEDIGEVNWLVHDAIEKEIPIPVISQSIMELFKSRDEKCDAYRAVAMMRNGFGGHPFGKDETMARNRRTNRIEKI